MATKPTRMQQQACDQLAEALVLITEASRLDGKAKFDADDRGLRADSRHFSLITNTTSPDGLILPAAIEHV
jgi:hypothetical protein